LIALDPPRSGLDEPVVEALAQCEARRLAYVSCEPEALKRDLPRLRAAGFRTTRVTPFDMFPQTGHVEAVACLERTT
jgi:tRNA/tmRNA/rRNA uracil-C5-methylase (TrmA/RlmC/RlmD family)